MKTIVPNKISWWNLRRASEASNREANEITASVRKLFEGKDGICRIILGMDDDPVQLEWREGTPSGVRTGKLESAYIPEEGYPDVRMDLAADASPEKDVVSQIVVLNGTILIQTASQKSFVISTKKLYRI